MLRLLYIVTINSSFAIFGLFTAPNVKGDLNKIKCLCDIRKISLRLFFQTKQMHLHFLRIRFHILPWQFYFLHGECEKLETFVYFFIKLWRPWMRFYLKMFNFVVLFCRMIMPLPIDITTWSSPNMSAMHAIWSALREAWTDAWIPHSLSVEELFQFIMLVIHRLWT
jgi:hypothetical protein